MARRAAHRRPRARISLSAAVLSVVLVLGVTVALLGPFAPRASADNGPSWSEVQAAKSNRDKQAAVVTQIESLLSGLEQKAARLGTAALKAANAADAAKQALEQAQKTVSSLQTQSRQAAKKAAAARRDAGAVATQLYRAGDPSLQVWLSGSSSKSLLYRLGALQQIDGTSSARLVQAQALQRTASSLGSQAKLASGIRDQLAVKATQAATKAKKAQQAAEAEVAATKKQQATLEAKLAALNATYQAKKSDYEAAQAAKAAAAASGDGGGSSGTIGSITAGPGSLSPSAAQAYASSRLSAYGWGSGQFSCLVSLWNIESGWQWNAENSSSGAYGIPQALPANKMASAGSDWTNNARTQIEWGLGYIQAAYGSPCKAYAFETSHTPYWY